MFTKACDRSETSEEMILTKPRTTATTTPYVPNLNSTSQNKASSKVSCTFITFSIVIAVTVLAIISVIIYIVFFRSPTHNITSKLGQTALWSVADNFTSADHPTWEDWYSEFDNYTSVVKGDWIADFSWEPIPWKADGDDSITYVGISESIVDSETSCPESQQMLTDQLSPNTTLYLEQYVFEQRSEDYPDSYPYWLRDEDGERVTFWEGSFVMDMQQRKYRNHILTRIVNRHQCLGADKPNVGIFLDNVCNFQSGDDEEESNAWLSLLKKLRRRLPNTPILANCGWDGTVNDYHGEIEKYASILFEDAIAHVDIYDDGSGDAAWIVDDTVRFYIWNQRKSGVNEVFGSRNDTSSIMREYARTLVYSDLGFRYADGTYGHMHIWYWLFDQALGDAIDDAQSPTGSLVCRQYSLGTVCDCPLEAVGGCDVSGVVGRRAGVWGWDDDWSGLLTAGEGLVLVVE